MTKSRKHSTTSKKRTTSEAPLKSFHEEYYRDMFTFKTNPVSLDYLKKFALEWVMYVETNPKKMSRVSFFNAKGVLATTVDRWIDRCPELAEAEQFVLQLLNERRELAPCENILTEGWVRYTHSLYDPKFKSLEEWKSAMKEKIAGSTGTIRVVELEKYPDSPLVPVKKEVND